MKDFVTWNNVTSHGLGNTNGNAERATEAIQRFKKKNLTEKLALTCKVQMQTGMPRKSLGMEGLHLQQIRGPTLISCVGV